ncbi:Acetyltransferase (GNAT) domain-containing protein [Peptoclostridium litorale DSM 5388]|uniref:Acetyltransferase family protein n=1 Tax=Peptoclostridium litorale DSM 5388 TaxID=1121324 RepID=A0A069RFK7_PEPLI|nr:GNAT family N-acetyltransferase [Peptoclostridium litorale]KDR95824.1 acetyltransferase family protein [Peptoclostridium litorale DSM 5388]SIO20595.1 Acetyltransferase (GNAT) domain-containing protein [Peptoclostridium litorale DSM 5388]
MDTNKNINIGPASTDQFKNAVDLINKVFRTSRGHKPTMQSEFPLLISRENLNNMIVVKYKGEVVSCVNFIPETIHVQNSLITAASIGAVCTSEDFRGAGLSSSLLDHAEEKMIRDGIDVVLISGTRSLYKRRGCLELENFTEYEIKPFDMEPEFEISPLEHCHIEDIISSYHQISTRYSRTRDEFETLLDSATIPWGNFTYEKYALIHGGRFIGYIVLRVIDSEQKYGQVIECFGNPDVIYSALSKLANELSLSFIKHYVHKRDFINNMDSYCNGKSCSLHGTLKVLNPEGLIRSLYPYFSQYVNISVIEKMDFDFTPGSYSIRLDGECLEIGSLENLTRLIFEGTESTPIEKWTSPNIIRILDTVFPLPFIWTANLNYQ